MEKLNCVLVIHIARFLIVLDLPEAQRLSCVGCLEFEGNKRNWCPRVLVTRPTISTNNTYVICADWSQMLQTQYFIFKGQYLQLKDYTCCIAWRSEKNQRGKYYRLLIPSLVHSMSVYPKLEQTCPGIRKHVDQTFQESRENSACPTMLNIINRKRWAF